MAPDTNGLMLAPTGLWSFTYADDSCVASVHCRSTYSRDGCLAGRWHGPSAM